MADLDDHLLPVCLWTKPLLDRALGLCVFPVPASTGGILGELDLQLRRAPCGKLHCGPRANGMVCAANHVAPPKRSLFGKLRGSTMTFSTV